MATQVPLIRRGSAAVLVVCLVIILAGQAAPAHSAPLSAPIKAAAQLGALQHTLYLPLVQSSGGLQVLLFQMKKTTGAVNENMFFEFRVTNTSSSAITFGILAAHTDQGVTADSWHDPLRAGEVLDWEDHLNFPNAGIYHVYLGICYGSHDACKTGGAPWTQLSNSISVAIQ